MPSYFILVPILLPVIVGILLLIFPIEDQYHPCSVAFDTPSDRKLLYVLTGGTSAADTEY